MKMDLMDRFLTTLITELADRARTLGTADYTDSAYKYSESHKLYDDASLVFELLMEHRGVAITQYFLD